jgi:hypothetical protein
MPDARAVVENLAETHAVGVMPAAILAFYSVGAFLPGRQAGVALAVGLAGLSGDVLLERGGPSGLAFGAIVLAVLPWVVGRVVRHHAVRECVSRAYVETLDAGQEQSAREPAHRERARIARELRPAARASTGASP